MQAERSTQRRSQTRKPLQQAEAEVTDLHSAASQAEQLMRAQESAWASCSRSDGMKMPGRARTVLSAVVSPLPSAPPSKIRTLSSSQTARLESLTEPGMTAFRLVAR